MLINLIKLDLYPFTFLILVSCSFLFSFNSFIMFWILMEINLGLFVVVSIFLSEEFFHPVVFEKSFFYLMIQCIGSLGFLFFSFYSWGFLFDDRLSLIFSLFLCLKLALFPFHSWFFKFCEGTGVYVLVLVLTIQKLPFLIMSTYLASNSFLILGGFSAVLGSFYLSKSSGITELAVSSSLYVFFWFYLFFCFSFLIGMLLFVIYGLSTFLFLIKTIELNFMNSLFSSVSFYVFFAYSLGLPPLSLFFVKFYVVLDCFKFLGDYLLTSIIFGTLLSLLGYFTFLYKFGSFSFNFHSDFSYFGFDKVSFFFLSLVSFSFFFY